MVAVIAAIVGLFFLSSYGRDAQAFIFGTPCQEGFVYNSETKTCTAAQVNLTCGAGTYLKQDAKGGYVCQLSNVSYILIFGAGGLILLWYLRRKRELVWRPAKDCLRWSFENGHLKTENGRDNFVSVWQHVKETHQIIPHNGWLFVGDFVKPGAEYTAMVVGTDETGWVLDLWRSPLVERQIQVLKKQGMKLEQALTEVAEAQKRVSKATEIFKEQEEAV